MQAIKTTLVHKIAPLSDSSGLHPALILLHGRGANEDDLLGLVPYFDPRLLIIAARAPFPFQYGGATWYDVLQVGAPHPQQFAESYERLKQFVHDVNEHYPVDPARLSFLGFSMGTVMSYAFSLTHPESVDSVVAHSGYVPEDTSLVFSWEKLKGKGFFVAHGTEDPVIGVELGRRAHELLKKTEAEVEYHEYPIPHSMSEESVNSLAAWLQRRAARKEDDEK